MPAAKPILYSYWRSSCSWRIRIALNLKKIDYTLEPVNLAESQKNLQKIADKTDFALIPVLQIDDTVLTESLAIIEYLEEKFPDRKALLPGSAEDRAKIRALALQIIANTQPLQNLRVLQYFPEPSQRAAWAKHWITFNFTKLEKALKKTAGKYGYGDQLSLVDVCIPAQVYNAKRFGVDMSQFPTIARLVEELGKIPEFIAADCHNQEDTPESERKK
ncbi:putative maleylacetoacetate isomerase 2 [Ditylenchus destructor]|uniref:maleylacetoacetate isomerase n=1 Tax=Ditylenchus destructor TaxID=166010 RepID=A0AAD4R3F2_9BILA|nr:putative maleylacetoacetate isomerase 2 [Ditylenchus destructor]